MKFINIPVQLWNSKESRYETRPRLFNPQHVVSLEPAIGINETAGTLRTVDGHFHSIPPEAYHEAFVALMGEEGA